MIKLVCGQCDEPAKYVITALNQHLSVCGKCSQDLWNEWRPLTNPMVKNWHQEVIANGMVH